MPILIHCKACGGTGKIASMPLSSCFNALSTSQWRSTAQIHARLPLGKYIGQTAVSNRLAKLQSLGYAVMEQRGHEKFWKRISIKCAAQK